LFRLERVGLVVKKIKLTWLDILNTKIMPIGVKHPKMEFDEVDVFGLPTQDFTDQMPFLSLT